MAEAAAARVGTEGNCSAPDLAAAADAADGVMAVLRALASADDSDAVGMVAESCCLEDFCADRGGAR